MTVTPPAAVAREAERGLKLRASLPPSKRCCTKVGIRRAVQLKHRQAVSEKTLKRMKAYFDRHRVDKKGRGWGVDSKGYQAWLLWGGDAGYEWAKKMLASFEPNPGHLQHVESELGSASLDDFAAYYPATERGDYKDEPVPYFVRNVVWIGDEGKMLRAYPEYTQHIWGNIFDPDKLAAVVAGVQQHPERLYFHAPYGTASRIDRERIKESFDYWEDEGFDRPYTTGDEYLDEYLADPDEHLSSFGDPGDHGYEEERQEMEAALTEAEESGDGDFGQWVVTIRDGNHRAFGSMLAGEPYVYVRLEDNQYEDLKHAAEKGTLTEEQAELWDMLE